MSATQTKTLARLFLAVTSILFTIGLAEIGLRLFRPINYMRARSREESQTQMLLHQASSIPGLRYEMAPSKQIVWQGVPMKTNSYGMRGDEPRSPKSNSLVRIAALGDSYTFGLGVRADEAYPEILERLLNESPANDGHHFSVLNFGVIGYCTRDEALVLRYKALAWDPEVVIIGYVLNDPEIDPVEPNPAAFRKTRWWQYFHLFRMIARVEHNREIRQLGGGDYYKYLHAEAGQKWHSVVQAFSEIHDLTSTRRIPVLVVIFPIVYGKLWAETWADYPYLKIHKQVADLAIRNGFHVIDLYEVYRHYAPRDVIISPFDDHPAGLGHELAARAIAEKLLGQGSLFFTANRPAPGR